MLLLMQYKAQRQTGEVLNIEEVGFNAYSQTYEDGILLKIFSVIGFKTRTCVDIGCGGILFSNTANLIVNHSFTGLLIDGDTGKIENAREFYLHHPETALFPPDLLADTITAENANELLSEHEVTGEIDLLCIDIDGIDYWIWKALETVDPRVVVVEYQDILGAERSWTVPYDPQFNADDYQVNREMKNYCGASLPAFVKLAKKKGYRLIGANRGGWNAFFVKNELATTLLPEVDARSCLGSAWNTWGQEHRFPLVERMEWQEV